MSKLASWVALAAALAIFAFGPATAAPGQRAAAASGSSAIKSKAAAQKLQHRSAGKNSRAFEAKFDKGEQKMLIDGKTQFVNGKRVEVDIRDQHGSVSVHSRTKVSSRVPKAPVNIVSTLRSSWEDGNDDTLGYDLSFAKVRLQQTHKIEKTEANGSSTIFRRKILVGNNASATPTYKSVTRRLTANFQLSIEKETDVASYKPGTTSIVRITSQSRTDDAERLYISMRDSTTGPRFTVIGAENIATDPELAEAVTKARSMLAKSSSASDHWLRQAVAALDAELSSTSAH